MEEEESEWSRKEQKKVELSLPPPQPQPCYPTNDPIIPAQPIHLSADYYGTISMILKSTESAQSTVSLTFAQGPERTKQGHQLPIVLKSINKRWNGAC